MKAAQTRSAAVEVDHNTWCLLFNGGRTCDCDAFVKQGTPTGFRAVELLARVDWKDVPVAALKKARASIDAEIGRRQIGGRS